MRHAWCILYLTLAFRHAGVSAPGDRFLGGSHDGWSRSAFIQCSAVENEQIFLGGTNDGYASGSFVQYDYDNSPQRVSPRFLGGTQDGYAQQRYSPFDQDTSSIYVSPRFTGGPFDGEDAAIATNLTNPLTLASDGDTLPDWWEVQYYSDLSIGEDDDTDGDGATSYEEMIADTQPTNSASIFEIIRLSSATGTAMVSFLSRDTRVYDVFCRSTNTAVWQPVTLFTNVPGDPTGTNVLYIPRTNSAGYYHVRVKTRP